MQTMREARVKTHQLNAIRPAATRYSHRVGSIFETIMNEGKRKGVSATPRMHRIVHNSGTRISTAWVSGMIANAPYQNRSETA